MRRFKISKITDKDKIIKAIKNVFHPTDENFSYDINANEPYCQIENNFYLIKDINDMLDLKLSLKKSLEDKINNTINKLKLKNFNLPIDKIIDEKNINELLLNKAFLEKKGILYDEHTKIYFIKTNEKLDDILTKNDSIEPENINDNEYTENAEFGKFKWLKNKDGFIGLKSPSGKFIIKFEEKFDGIDIYNNRNFISLTKGNKLFLYSKYGKLLNKDGFDDIYTLKEMNVPDKQDLLIFRIDDYFGIINNKGVKIISEDEKIENFEDLENKYKEIESPNKEENNFETVVDDNKEQIKNIKLKDTIFSGTPEQIKQNISRALQKNGFNIVISKRNKF